MKLFKVDENDSMLEESPEFSKIVESIAYLKLEELVNILNSEWYRSNKVSLIRILKDQLKFYSSSLSIITIAHCWDAVVLYAVANKKQSELIDNVSSSLASINKILKKRFNDFNDSIYFRSFYEKNEYVILGLTNKSDRTLDRELCETIDEGYIYKLSDFLNYGANPWLMLSNGKSLFRTIEELRESLFHELLELYTTSKDVKRILYVLRNFALYDSVISEIGKFYPDKESNKCLQAIPRVIYSVSYPFQGFSGQYKVDMSYNPETDEYIIKDISKCEMYFGRTAKIKIIMSALKKVLSDEFINSFIKMEKPSFGIDVLDGTSYSLTVVSKDGDYRTMYFNDYEGPRIHHVKYLIDNLELNREPVTINGRIL